MAQSAITIDPDMTIEELVREYPKSVRFLSRKGIKCIACGEPIWGTLREAALEKGFDEKQIEQIAVELAQYLVEENE